LFTATLFYLGDSNVRKWLIVLVLLAACVSVNKSILSRSRIAQPVPRDSVRVFLPGDTVPQNERIALLHARSNESFTNEGKMIDKMREEAGKLGANAIILGEIKDPGTVARVASVVFGTPADRQGQAIAVYIEPANLRRSP
jgi:hypothetical protein